ncbi:DUF4389 domain-containing protein [Modestobacter sp. VKM Ac-2979]|uniref:DUF4389 domain-containing protein n=1 Tax=unclassified Modestobacter TaxID=2643866 RepID=UPI0022ABC465|nr:MULTISPECIES: DUF4389 domain-containing protein [unclassified Modestobacter]MCZ2812098.1 DUF4389 domain-containing protein [Modestobacter sp. VKM Ac-2979]MCZ2843822.1 DUF4389 domain-containing protein [Modestobacter sp. VKM Ac-2980]
MTDRPPPYPVRVDAALEPGLSRWLWLVKWLLLIPHFIVLAFLWTAFVVLSVVAFFAILFTGRYPAGVFDFNVGVLRWTWRVHYYGYGALGTDRYPPFTLADVPDYPARLDVARPERLSRGLVLVKWWLLAVPHYLVLAVFVGGGVWLGTRTGPEDGWDSGWGAGGLVGLLVFIAAVVLLFTGRYPRPLYDFVMGMDRWALRVAAYAGLMTDRYPPFRLDMGGADPGSVPGGPPPVAPPGAGAAPVAGPATAGSTASPAVGGLPMAQPRSNWTAGRVVSVVIGSVLLFAATGLIGGGGALLWADQAGRDDGYLWTPTVELGAESYAVVSDGLRLETAGEQWVIDDFLGTARLEVAAVDPDTELFVGIAPTAAVDRYLDGVAHRVVEDVGTTWPGDQPEVDRWTDVAGGAPEQLPGELDIWAAQASGSGSQTLTWRPADGSWTAVIMRADGEPGLTADAQAAATVPALGWISVALLATGAVLIAAGVLLVALAVHRAHRYPPSDATPSHAGSPMPPPPSSPTNPAVGSSASGAPR